MMNLMKTLKTFLQIKENKETCLFKSYKKKYLDGEQERDFVYVKDCINTLVWFLDNKKVSGIFNIGTGKDYSVKWYANFVSEKLNYKVFIDFDKSMPGGTKRKVLNTKLSQKYHWMPKISLNEGFKLTFKDFLRKNAINIRY